MTTQKLSLFSLPAATETNGHKCTFLTRTMPAIATSPSGPLMIRLVVSHFFAMKYWFRHFSTPPNAEQPGTATHINTGGTVALFQAHYRAVPGHHGIWATQVISYTLANKPRAAIRLYEIMPGALGLWNQVTFVDQDFDVFNPSLATDDRGNLVVSFSLSGPADYPSIFYSGRRFEDPTNTVDAGIYPVKSSVVSYEAGNPSPWGDYSGTALDPANDNMIWMFNEFAKTNSSWGTWIGTAYHDFRVFLPVVLNNS